MSDISQGLESLGQITGVERTPGTGTEHPHTAQSPVVYDFAAKNPKNKR